MYPLSFDYLDGFSVLVGGDFVIVGGHSDPLGSYAADALNIDEAFLSELFELTRTVRDEFRCYSAARDTLSRALMKEAIGKALLAVYRLLPYQRLYEDGKGRILSMQTNEELETSALTPGTEEHTVVQGWLERLCDLPRAVERFQRHAHAFLDEFLPDDIERKQAAYAEAYQRYWMHDHLTAFALEDEVFEHSGSDFFAARDNARRELDYRSFPRSFDVTVSYRTTANPKNTQELMMVEEIGFKDWETFVSLGCFADSLPDTFRVDARIAESISCWTAVTTFAIAETPRPMRKEKPAGRSAHIERRVQRTSTIRSALRITGFTIE